MRFKTIARVLYTTLLLCIAAAAWHELVGFQGFLRLELGHPEHVAFAPSDDNSAWRGRLALPPELLSFDNPRTMHRLNDKLSYTTRELPFAVRLDDTIVLREFPPVNQLVIKQEGAGSTQEIAPGAAVPSPLGPLRVVDLREWQGLVAHPRGVHCARVVWAPAQWAEQSITLEADRWVIPAPGLALLLRWHGSEAEARAAAESAHRPGLEAAWWTVKQGEGELRFNSFAPGAGAEMEDGSAWTVERLEQREGKTLLVLRVEGDGAARTVELTPNVQDAAAVARFLAPGAADTVVMIEAWQDNLAVAAVLGANPEPDVYDISPGAPVPLAGGARIYPLQVLAYGLPVTASATPLFEAVLERADGMRLYLTERKAATVAEASLLFQRKRPEALRSLKLSLYDRTTKQAQESTLAPGETLRHAGSSIGLESSAAQEATLRIRLHGITPTRLAGFILFALGAYAWALRGVLWGRVEEGEDKLAKES